MKAHEHRAIGNEATGGAMVDLGPPSRLLLRHGDVVALSGDFFAPDGAVALEPGSASSEDFGPGLFERAATPGGDGGGDVGFRNEIISALRVMAHDEAVVDARFEPGGQFADVAVAASGGRSDPEGVVRDRFLALAAANADHFVDPWAGARGPAGATTSGYASARDAYRHLHQTALEHACRLGRLGGALTQAMAREAAAQHYLTDAFAAGHLRTPVVAIRRFWQERYPDFWTSLRRKVASDTAAALRDLAPVLRLLPARVLHDRTLAAVCDRTERFPPVSLGDLLARVYHDWDNDHGLVLPGGELLFGDGHLGEGEGWALAVAAVRAGNDDVEIALGLGRAGRQLTGEALYQAVREASGAGGSDFRAETWIPRLGSDNPPLNWRAADVEELWATPIAGTSGPTVGQAVGAALEPGGEVARRLDALGSGITEALDVPAVPGLRRWLGRKAAQAYQDGFVAELARDPKGSVLAVVNGATGGSSDGWIPVGLTGMGQRA